MRNFKLFTSLSEEMTNKNNISSKKRNPQEPITDDSSNNKSNKRTSLGSNRKFTQAKRKASDPNNLASDDSSQKNAQKPTVIAYVKSDIDLFSAILTC